MTDSRMSVWEALESAIEALQGTMKGLPFAVVTCVRCGKRTVVDKDPATGRLNLREQGWDDDVVDMSSTVEHIGYFCPEHIEEI